MRNLSFVMLLIASKTMGLELSYDNGVAIIFVDNNHAYVVQPEDLNVEYINAVSLLSQCITSGHIIYSFVSWTNAGDIIFELSYESGEITYGSECINTQYFYWE